MWEELNRPRGEQHRASPTPTPDQATPDAVDAGHAASPQVVTGAAAYGEATTGDRIDPQHLLLVGAALFVGVTFFALSGLGGSGGTTGQAAPAAASSPSVLAAVDDEAMEIEVEVSTTIVTPTTTAAPQAMAMGLPASLLDTEQSQVFRLYRTALGREPDRSGFEFWSDQIRAGIPLEQLANEFLASTEYQGQFTEGTAWDNRAERLLTNAFGPAADKAELDAWRGRFTGLDGAELLLAISEADETLAVTGTLR